MHKFFYLLLYSFICTASYAQPGEWKVYTSKNNVRDLTTTSNKIWAATTGGIFSYDLLTDGYEDYTTLNGLKSHDITSIYADKNENLWIGSSNGYIQNVRLNKKWFYYNDIYFTTEVEKTINSFIQYGDTLYICSAIGVHVFIISREEFSDNYTRFGMSPQLMGKVNSLLIWNDSIWIATDNGIAQAPISHPNLAVPQAWKVFTTLQGLPSIKVRKLVAFKNSLIAATSTGIARYDNGTFRTLPTTLGKNIISIETTDSNAYFISEYELWQINDENITLIANSFPSLLTSLLVKSEGFYLGTEENGIIQLRDDIRKNILPNCPPTNRIIGLAVDEKGELWTGTATAYGKGFLRFDGNIWYQYNVDNYPILGLPEYYRVDIGRDNTKWVSGWGPGVALVGSDNQIKKVFNTTNGLPPTLFDNPTYVVVAGVATDREGNAWINVRTGRGDTLLAVFNSDSSFSYVRSPYSFTSIGITIDHNSTKWLWTGGNQSAGLFFYNELDTIRGMLYGTRWGKVNRTNGLNSDNISVVTVDKDGEVWVGTADAGINIIYDPSNPLNRIAVYSPLRGQKINDILVDPLNQKWVATSLGVYLLNQDGTAILEQYTYENTGGKLVDNNVLSLALNRNDGTIYFGTEKGLSSLKTYSVQPLRNFDEIIISPNPFLLSSQKNVLIDGLVENSIIKILTASGELVKEFQSPGGRIASWNGTNKNNEEVPTGIYIIVAYSNEGKKIGTGKIVVLK